MLKLTRREEREHTVAIGESQVVAVAATLQIALRVGTMAVAWQRRTPARLEVIGADGRVTVLRVTDVAAALRTALAGWLLWRWLRR